MDHRNIEAVVFDMGGVLVELGAISEIVGEEEQLGPDEFWSSWLASPSVRAFERGRLEPTEFASALVSELGLSATPDELLDRFRRWPKGLYLGAVALVEELRAKGLPVCVLTNTNSLHWNTQPDHGTISEMFDHVFASYALDMVKPDHEIFEHVITQLGLDPGAILFLDDNQINVEGAKESGLASAIVSGVQGARSELEKWHLV